MTDEQIRVAVAEAIYEHGKDKRGRFWKLPCGNGVKSVHSASLLPDYPNDLNAMHEAVSTLNELERHKFLGALDLVTARRVPESWFPARFLDATARDWAEAFLRTIGKWQE